MTTLNLIESFPRRLAAGPKGESKQRSQWLWVATEFALCPLGPCTSRDLFDQIKRSPGTCQYHHDMNKLSLVLTKQCVPL
jgi:hypothetical protein